MEPYGHVVVKVIFFKLHFPKYGQTSYIKRCKIIHVIRMDEI